MMNTDIMVGRDDMRKMKWPKVCGLIAGVFLCAMITTYITGCYATEESLTWQMDSEDLVWGRILQMQQGDENPGALLGTYTTPDSFAGYLKVAFLDGQIEGEFHPYTSQSGLQGTLFGAIDLLFEKAMLDTYLRWTIFRAINAVLFVAMMLFLGLWLWRKTGILGALAAFSCSFLSTYSTMTMSNLYWVTWTMLLPMVLSAAVCEWVKEGKRRTIAAVSLVGVSVLIRCMCGFEFISVVMVAAELPIVLEWLLAEPRERKSWFLLAVWVGLAQLAAFALAIMIWVVQLCLESDDRRSAVSVVVQTIAKRTGLFSQSVAENPVVLESLQASKYQVLQQYLPQKLFLDLLTIKQILSIAVVSFLPLIPFGIRDKKRVPNIVSQAKFTGLAIFSLSAPMSWFILASGHSWLHTHVNVFLWLIPSVPLLLAAAGGNVQLLIKNIRGRF